MRSLVLPPKCSNFLKRFMRKREIQKTLQDSKRPKGLRLFDFFPNNGKWGKWRAHFIEAPWPNFCHGPSIFMILSYISLIENFSMLHSSTQLNPMNDVKCQKTFGTCPTTCLCGSPHALHACIHPFTSKPEYPLFKVGLLKRPSVMDFVRNNFHSKIAQ